MKNNYPIKYAAMPIIGYVAWRREGVIGYIASKCYEIQEIKQYNRDGTTKTTYSVVFPYTKEVDNNRVMQWERIEPLGEQDQTSVTVENVYNTLEEAKQEAERKNKKILTSKINNIFTSPEKFPQQRKIVEEEHQQQMELFKRLEQEIEEKTEDLVVNSTPKPQNIIIINNRGRKECDMSLYDYLNFMSKELLFVFHLSEEDYQTLSTRIKNEEFLPMDTLEKAELILINNPEEEITHIINPNSEEDSHFYLKQREYYGNQKFMYYDETMISHPIDRNRSLAGAISIFTTETYEDIIKSYLPYFISTGNILPSDNKTYRKIYSPNITLLKQPKE